jgi:hypothetical protein
VADSATGAVSIAKTSFGAAGRIATIDGATTLAWLVRTTGTAKRESLIWLSCSPYDKSARVPYNA